MLKGSLLGKLLIWELNNILFALTYHVYFKSFVSQAYLGPSQTSVMEFIYKNN